jgi:hypothetical protein
MPRVRDGTGGRRTRFSSRPSRVVVIVSVTVSKVVVVSASRRMDAVEVEGTAAVYLGQSTPLHSTPPPG